MDYYAILQVSRSATIEEIKQNYKKLALQCHPDRHATKSTQEQADWMEKFKRVGEAFEILSDPYKRRCYDHKQDGVQNQHCAYNTSTYDPFDLFKQFFGTNRYDTPYMESFRQDFSLFSNQFSSIRNHSQFNMSSRSESIVNGVRTIKQKRKDKNGNYEEILEYIHGDKRAKIIKKNGQIIHKSGDMRLIK